MYGYYVCCMLITSGSLRVKVKSHWNTKCYQKWKNVCCSEREDCNQCNHYEYCCEVPVKVLAWPLESWESMHLNKWPAECWAWWIYWGGSFCRRRLNSVSWKHKINDLYHHQSFFLIVLCTAHPHIHHGVTDSFISFHFLPTPNVKQTLTFHGW